MKKHLTDGLHAYRLRPEHAARVQHAADLPDGVLPCRVLDPFCGTGTTAQVAAWMGRDATGIELSEDYVNIANAKIQRKPRCLRTNNQKPSVTKLPNQQLLF